MERDKFVGSWQLVSFEFRHSDGTVSYPMGEAPAGMLMYDKAGNMSAQLMQRERPLFAVADHHKGSPEEIKAAFEGFTAYFGTYEVDEEKGSVTHYVSGALLPNVVGKRQVRFFEFKDNQLILSTPPMPWGGEQKTGVLVWRRTG